MSRPREKIKDTLQNTDQEDFELKILGYLFCVIKSCFIQIYFDTVIKHLCNKNKKVHMSLLNVIINPGNLKVA